MRIKWTFILCALFCVLLLGGCSIAEEALHQAMGELAEEHEETESKREDEKEAGTIEAQETETSTERSGEDGFLRPKLAVYIDSGSFNNRYYSEKLFDGNEDTCWAGHSYKTRDAYITIYFEEPFTISDISIVNGSWEEEEESFYRAARLKSFTLTYDDGTKDNFTIKSGDDRYWSESIIPKTTSAVMLTVTDVYDGMAEDRPLAISELEFFYNPDSMFANQTEPAKTQEPTQEEVQGDQTENTVDYTPSWYNWAPTGYDAQDIDLVYLQAGKWISKDGQTVLYTDFSSSPDMMDFGIYYHGEVYADQSYAEVNWEDLNSEGEPYQATDSQHGFSFSVPEKGVMEVARDGDIVELYLRRAKYQ